MRLLILLLACTRVWAAELPEESRQMREKMEAAALRYFLENSNPETGLTLDGAENFAPQSPDNRRASIAATGFSLAVLANAAERGSLSRDDAEAKIERTLRFVRDHVGSHEGWLVHFVDWQTGAAMPNTEYSTIDTALFLAGALYAGQVFHGTPVRALAHELYAKVNFQRMMTDGGTRPEKRTLSLAYSETKGYSKFQWGAYSEEMILYALGLGSDTFPLPADSWSSFQREGTTLPDGSYLIGSEKPLFVHQYSQLFLDLRDFRDRYGNYFVNSVRATRFNRDICLAHPSYKTFAQGFWGLSAGENIHGYGVYSPAHYDGTVCLGCAIGSAMFDPEMVLADANAWAEGPFAGKIWGRYGFVDSLNLDQDWYATKVLGITMGPLYLSLANTDDEHSVWQVFRRIPEIERGMRRAGPASPW